MQLPARGVSQADRRLTRAGPLDSADVEHGGRVYTTPDVVDDPVWRTRGRDWEMRLLDFRVVQREGGTRVDGEPAASGRSRFWSCCWSAQPRAAAPPISGRSNPWAVTATLRSAVPGATSSVLEVRAWNRRGAMYRLDKRTWSSNSRHRIAGAGARARRGDDRGHSLLPDALGPEGPSGGSRAARGLGDYVGRRTSWPFQPLDRDRPLVERRWRASLPPGLRGPMITQAVGGMGWFMAPSAAGTGDTFPERIF